MHACMLGVDMVETHGYIRAGTPMGGIQVCKYKRTCRNTDGRVHAPAFERVT